MYIYEDYISNLKNIYNTDDLFILITRFPPAHKFKEDNVIVVYDLAPSTELFKLRKPKLISYEEYKYLYIKQIEREKFDERFYERFKFFNRNVCFLCFCKENTDCHRKILCELLEQKYNIKYKRKNECIEK